MFGQSKKELKEQIEEFKNELSSQIQRNANLNELNKEILNQYNEKARLVSIEVIKHKNVFKFIRNGKTFTIQTMSLLEDNVPQWRKDANLEVKNNG